MHWVDSKDGGLVYRDDCTYTSQQNIQKRGRNMRASNGIRTLDPTV